jgi:phage terminase large subunit
LYLRGLFVDDIANEIRSIVGKEKVTCDSSEPRSVQDIKRNGIKAIGAKKGAGSIEHGIKWLQGHKIIVDESCINAIKELSAHKWKEDKDGNVIPKPVDKDNHIIDAIRYALESEMKQNGLRTLNKSLLGI